MLNDKYGPGDGERLKTDHPDRWLWCMHCERVFQAKDLQPDDGEMMDGCAWFVSDDSAEAISDGECDAAGLDIDIFDFLEGFPTRTLHWPTTTDGLVKGRVFPLHQE